MVGPSSVPQGEEKTGSEGVTGGLAGGRRPPIKPAAARGRPGWRAAGGLAEGWVPRLPAPPRSSLESCKGPDSTPSPESLLLPRREASGGWLSPAPRAGTGLLRTAQARWPEATQCSLRKWLSLWQHFGNDSQPPRRCPGGKAPARCGHGPQPLAAQVPRDPLWPHGRLAHFQEHHLSLSRCVSCSARASGSHAAHPERPAAPGAWLDMELPPGAHNGTAAGLELPRALANGSAALSERQQYAIGLFLSCLYTIFLFPIGFVGNLLILVVNIRFREKMTIPDLYFINLAAADLVLVADSLIEVFNLGEQYYDIAALCTFMALFLQVNMYSSVFFLTWMSFDRYLALAKAVRCGPFRTKPRARLSCGLIWMASVSATLVPFTAVHLQHSEDACFCFADVREVQWLEVTLGFVLPFAVIGLCYSLIARVLVGAQRRRGLRPRRRKALRMILAVVLVFFVCWLPENVFISVHLLQRAPPGAAPCQRSPRHAHPLASHVVNLAAFSNSCLNPLIYSFLGETFRDKLRLYLEQKTGLSALNRLCHAALKAVVPDGAEQAEVKLSSTV